MYQRLRKNILLHKLFVLSSFSCVLLALFLRINGLPDGVIFGYDQARDAFRTRSILTEKNLLLVGPETDIPGVHHGILYYYFLALPYGLNSSPVLASIVQATIHAVSTLLIIGVSVSLFGGTIIPIIAGLLFAVSFEFVQYAKWLSNPSFSVITLLLFYWGLFQTIRGKTWGIIISFIFLAISIHFQLFLTYLIGLIIIVLLVYRPKKIVTPLLIGVCLFGFILSPFLISELRFNWQSIRGFLDFFQSHSSYNSPIILVTKMIEQTILVNTHLFTPTISNGGLWLFLFSFLTVLLTKQSIQYLKRFLLLILFYSFSVFFFSSGALGTEFGFIAGVIPLFFIYLYTLHISLQTKLLLIPAIPILIGVIVSNTLHSFQTGTKGAYIFSIQKSMTYGLEMQILDYIYNDANKEPYSICTLTNPLHINTTWAYVFSAYGLPKYGYLPFYAGPGQTGRLGETVFSPDTTKPKKRYIIYEPLIGFTDGIKDAVTTMENGVSTIIKLKKFGDFTVEKRLLQFAQIDDPSYRKRQQLLLRYGSLFSCFN